MASEERILPHSGTMAPLGTWFRLLWENGGASPTYWGRLARILLPTTMAIPLRVAERLRWGGAVARTRVDKAPVFVVGVARSGTTHLHNLLSQDPQYGFVSTFQAAVPTMFLSGRGWLKELMARLAPASRPMDAMRVAMDLPQEEDLAVANTCPMSAVYSLSFPQRAESYFNRYCFMRDLSARDMKRWERVYMEVLCKATLDAAGRRLVLKSPVNTGRIPHLLRLFPEARFIHIVRSPFAVCRSLLHTLRTVVPMHQLHPIADEVLENLALFIVRETLQQYLTDRESVPKGATRGSAFRGPGTESGAETGGSLRGTRSTGLGMRPVWDRDLLGGNLHLSKEPVHPRHAHGRTCPAGVPVRTGHVGLFASRQPTVCIV